MDSPSSPDTPANLVGKYLRRRAERPKFLQPKIDNHLVTKPASLGGLLLFRFGFVFWLAAFRLGRRLEHALQDLIALFFAFVIVRICHGYRTPKSRF